MRQRMIAFWTLCSLAAGGTAAMANVGVSARKLVVIDRGPLGGKAVFITTDSAVDKGAGTDPATIGATLDVTYDNGLDPAITGRFVAASGSPYWRANMPTVAKYVNENAPSGGSIRTLIVTSGERAKLVAKSPGDVPLNLRSQNGTKTGVATTALCIENEGARACFCSRFSSCTWEWTASRTGTRLECRDGMADPCEVQPTTTTTTLPPGPALRFRTAQGSGICGSVRSGGASGTVRKSLHCGALSLGSGGSVVPESSVPAGAETLFNVSCDGASCSVSGRTAEQTGSGGTCSDAGCQFGPYLSIANAGYSWCVQNTFSAPASGTLDGVLGTFEGRFPLSTVIYLTANAMRPCPPCLGGTPGVVDSGRCAAGWFSGTGASADEGEPCTPTSPTGDTYDCRPPIATVLPAFPLDLTSITTGTSSLSNPAGLFCPAQQMPGAFGCLGAPPTNAICPSGGVHPLIDHVSQTGSPAGLLLPGLHPAALVSTFCVPTVGGSLGFLLNAALGLPGPGAISLPGTLQLIP